MAKVLVFRVLYQSVARVRANSAEEAMEKTHRVVGGTLKQAAHIVPSNGDVDIENIDIRSATYCGTEEVEE